MSQSSFNRDHFIFHYNVRSLNPIIRLNKQQDFNTLNIKQPISTSENISKMEILKQYIKTLSPGIVGINETWLSKDDQIEFQLFGYKTLETRFTKKKGGVALLIHNSIQLENSKVIEEGRCIQAKVLFENISFNLIALYAPNKPHQRAEFWRKITNSQNNQEPNTVIFGDFNQVEDNQIDRIPIGTNPTQDELISITNLFKKLNLI